MKKRKITDDPKEYFLELLGLSKKNLRTLVREVLDGAEDGELYLERDVTVGLSLDEGRIESPSREISQGFGLRRVNGASICFASGNTISVAELQRAGREMGEVAEQHDRYIPFTFSKAKKYYTEKDMLTVSLARRVKLLKEIDACARLDTAVTNVSASLYASRTLVLVARADGTIVTDVRPMVRLGISVQCEGETKKRETGSFSIGGRHGYATVCTPSAWKPEVDRVIHETKEKLRTTACPAGEMIVVLGNGWAGVLLHEAVGHGLEGDFVWRKTTVFADMIGKRVASDLVTVVDDGTLQDARGSLNRDDEGTPTECTTLIKNGVLVRFMHDRQSARLCNMLPTGNGRRESYSYRPQVRMRNTYMLSGDTPPEEIIAKTKRGLYIGSFGGGSVDPISGQFVFKADMAYKIDGGKLTDPVIGATLIGNCATMLLYVDMVGNDGQLGGAGTCGKGGQNVPVGIGQPTLRLSGGVSVGGTETETN